MTETIKRKVIIPAAGKGTRLHGTDFDAPKVMRICAGRPLLETVLSSVDFINPEDIYIVVGYKKKLIQDHFGNKYNYVEQKEQLGTGHAVMMCEDAFKDFNGSVVVTFGDMPLFRREDIEGMFDKLESDDADCVLMTAENPNLDMWARIVRGNDGKFNAIVEGKDCDPEQAKIKELFAGVLAFKSRSLFDMLKEINTNNAQGEYYLTEVPEIMVRNGMKVETYFNKHGEDLYGVNTLEDLVRCEKELNSRIYNFSAKSLRLQP